MKTKLRQRPLLHPSRARSRAGFPETTILLVLVLSSCQGQPGDSCFVAASDSIGVRVVEHSASCWDQAPTWEVESTPAVEVGLFEGPEPYQLHDVKGAVRLSDGRIVVADGGSFELRFFDPEGEYLKSVGREGEGPGEFQALTHLGSTAGDTLIAWDFRSQRASFFTTEGDFVRGVQLGGSISARFGFPDMEGIIEENLVLLRTEGADDPFELEAGVVRLTDLLGAFHLDTGMLDSLLAVPGRETFVIPTESGVSGRPFLFGRFSDVASHAGKIIVGTNDEYSFHVHSADGGLERIVRVNRAPVRTSPQIVEEAVARWFGADIDSLTGPLLSFATDLSELPHPETLPAFRSLGVDQLGRIWVEDFHSPSGGEPSYAVFSVDGDLLGTLRIPPGRIRERIGYPRVPLVIGEDYILGVWVDALGVEYVRFYRYSRP